MVYASTIIVQISIKSSQLASRLKSSESQLNRQVKSMKRCADRTRSSDLFHIGPGNWSACFTCTRHLITPSTACATQAALKLRVRIAAHAYQPAALIRPHEMMWYDQLATPH
jgi:hypothetical protein